MATNLKTMRNDLLEIGTSAKNTYSETKDLKAALVAIKAYGEVTRLSSTQVQYKKLTGFPAKVPFLEED